MSAERVDVCEAIASLTPQQEKVLTGEAFRDGDDIVLRVFSPATRVGLARRGLLVDRMYSETLTELGVAVRQQLLVRGDRS